MTGLKGDSGEPSTSLLLLGGGGHARSVLEVIRECAIPVIGYLDECEVGGTKAPWCGTRNLLERSPKGWTYLPASGDNGLRKQDYSRLRRFELEICSALLSPRAVIANDVVVGRGAVVMPGAVLRTGVQVGACTIINSGAVVDHDCQIGDFAHVGPGAVLAGTVEVEEGALLGAGSRVLPGRRIGAWSTLGAGGVAVRDVESGSIYAGVPAVPIQTARS